MNTPHDHGNIFRERFAGYSKEPPADIWEKVKATIGSTPITGTVKKRKWWLPLIAGTMILVATVATLLWSQHERHLSAAQGITTPDIFIKSRTGINQVTENTGHTLFSCTPGSGNDIIRNKTQANTSTISKNHLAKDTKDEEPVQQQMLSQNNVKEQPYGSDKSDAEQNGNSDVSADPKLTGGASLTSNGINEKPETPIVNGGGPATANGAADQYLKEQDIQQGDGSGGQHADLVSDSMNNKTVPVMPVDYGKTSGWSIALNIVPEYMLTSFRGSKQKLNYSYEICGTYHLKGFMIEGGVGLGFSKNAVTHNQVYKVNEVSGTFEDVIAYVWDSTMGRPVFTTSTVNYYDSIQKDQQVNATDKNTILHIPLLLGYKYDVRNFTFMIKGGIQYSMVIHRKNMAIPEPVSGSRLIEDKPAGPAANKDGIALLLGCGVVYNVNHRIGIGIEPSFRYYSKNIYGMQDDAVKPYAAAIRAGMIIKL